MHNVVQRMCDCNVDSEEVGWPDACKPKQEPTLFLATTIMHQQSDGHNLDTNAKLREGINAKLTILYDSAG